VTVWLAGGILLSAVFWIAFARLRRRHQASASQAWAAAAQLGPAGLLSVAPWRSVLDPNYGDYVLGYLHFTGRSASLPATLVLASLLASAWILLRYRGGRPYAFPAAFNFLFGANLGYGIGKETPRFQLGEHLTLTGAPALAVVLALLVLPFLVVAGWCLRRLSRPLISARA
jgi:hypothetical protein